MHKAATDDRASVAGYLIDMGADIEAKDKVGAKGDCGFCVGQAVTIVRQLRPTTDVAGTLLTVSDP